MSVSSPTADSGTAVLPGVYLDYAASTPVDPQVAAGMAAVLATGPFGNPSSSHAWGRGAAQQVEQARAQVAALIGARPGEIVFTSGATESDNLAILGAARAAVGRGRHIITSRTEHKAVLDACKRLEREGCAVTWLDPGPAAAVTPAAVRAALRPDTVLVTLMHVNNETGVVQDIAGIGAECARQGVVFHTDAAQSAGRLPLEMGRLPVDLLSFTAHKLYGPKGIGALYVRGGLRPRVAPLMSGGEQEAGLRPGTLATHQVVGFGLACELTAALLPQETARLAVLRRRLAGALTALGGVHVNGGTAPQVPEILNVSFEGVEGESLLAALPELGVSTGAACNSARAEPSYVLRALGRSTALAESSLRFSFGRFTRPEDIDRAAAAVTRAVTRLRSISPGALTMAEEPAQALAPPAGDAYSPRVRELFTMLPHAGVIAGAAGRVLRGEAGTAADSAWVRFHLLVADGRVIDARFQGLGCPHTLAVASWLAGRLPGRELAQAVPGSPESWARDLTVPVEKLGRLLLIEDALRAALGDSARAAPENFT